MRKITLQILAFLMLITTSVFAQDGVVTKINRRVDVGTIDNFFDASLAPFYHGVASGDPLKDAVVIWTRVTANVSSANVTWKVATDARMYNVVAQGSLITNQNSDFTVKVDVRNLQPNKTYYYQFEALGKKSEVGKTRTTPVGDVSNVRFGVVSCSNYQDGYFNAYQELAERTDIDAVIHLGDYIYEYESGGYGYDKKIGRGHLPAGEIITLNDYRTRYSYYRLDPMLRNLHKQHPFILIWDDHEFANDASKYGAENHDDATEGSWEARKQNGYKAYFEWLPVRANSISEFNLYRDFSYGNLADLLMLDTRIEGRGEMTTASKEAKEKEAMLEAQDQLFKKQVQKTLKENPITTIDEAKTLLNTVLPYFLDTKKLSITEQAFVIDNLATVAYNYKNDGSRALKNGNQEKLEALLQKSVLKTSEKELLAKSTSYKSILGSAQFDWLLGKLSTSTATWKIIGNQVMMMFYRGIPTKDAWDGFPEERANIQEYIKSNDIKNVVVLTGDIHSTYAGNIMYNGECFASEFIVPSVTSENLDAYGWFAASIAESYTKSLNPNMKEVDLDNHGYYILDIKEDKVQADWYYMNDITKPNTGEYFYRGYYVNKDQCGIKRAYYPANASSKNNYGTYLENEVVAAKEYETLVILGVYPNPMIDEGNIHYVAQKETLVSVSVYNTSGQLVKRLLNNKKHHKGIYNLSFNPSELQSGMYIVKIEADNFSAAKQIIIK
ncbi:MAG: alkaline phosphatase D family protein [Tenacibaculum sp.]